ncbi:MAG: MarR family transcriptional regulator [Hahellaceae bacterium]|nr:MarR family transcriptional regulator [Hahellaceae bacterium]
MSVRSPTPPQLLLKHQVCHSLYSASNALIRAYRPLLDELDLTYPQYLVMLSLWERDGVIIRQISEQCRLDAPTLTPILKRLESKRLVRRGRSPIDERQRVIEVTAAGWALRDVAADIPARIACATGMTAEQGRQLRELTELLHRHLVEGESALAEG